MSETDDGIPQEMELYAIEGSNVVLVVNADNNKDVIAVVNRRTDNEDMLITAKMFASAPKVLFALLEIYRKVDLISVPGGSEELHSLAQDALSDLMLDVNLSEDDAGGLGDKNPAAG